MEHSQQCGPTYRDTARGEEVSRQPPERVSLPRTSHQTSIQFDRFATRGHPPQGTPFWARHALHGRDQEALGDPVSSTLHSQNSSIFCMAWLTDGSLGEAVGESMPLGAYPCGAKGFSDTFAVGVRENGYVSRSWRA